MVCEQGKGHGAGGHRLGKDPDGSDGGRPSGEDAGSGSAREDRCSYRSFDAAVGQGIAGISHGSSNLIR